MPPQELFDIRSYLRDRGIAILSERRGWIHIRDTHPFCGDVSGHLGISSTNSFSCFKCGEKGNLWDLLKRLEANDTPSVISRIVREYTPEVSSYIPPAQKSLSRAPYAIPGGILRLPPEADLDFRRHHLDYLSNRGFDPQYIIQKYKLRVTHNTGAYRFRFIIPIIMDGKAVAYTSRDYTGQQTPKYKTSRDCAFCQADHERKKQQPGCKDCYQGSLINPKECLYNVDRASGRVVVMEGPVDVWRFGDGSVATMGTAVKREQVAEIVRRFHTVFIMFDEDAYERAHALANALTGLINHVEVLEMDHGDPGDMTQQEVTEIRRELGF